MPTFKRVRSNVYSDGCSRPRPPSRDEAAVCRCTDKSGDCDEDVCELRGTFEECTRGLCPRGDRCRNQRIQRRQYCKGKVKYTGPERGFGYVAAEDVPAGALVTEYCGEVIDYDTMVQRLREIEEGPSKQFYIFQVSAETIIDAGPIGNNARFINHSCDPNCEAQKWDCRGTRRVGIFTKVPVPKGTEFTYNYNFRLLGNGLGFRCSCGSKNCAKDFRK